jgi:hypothetical protein
MDTSSIKNEVLQECKNYVAKRIATSTLAMEQAQRAANEEGKSSAGDKYETGRAMMQIERDKAAQQLNEALKLKEVLDRINPELKHEKISLGSMVITSTLKIFIAIGIGKLIVAGDDYLVVAPHSPLGKSLMGLNTNDTFTFSNTSNTIVKIL